MLNINFFAYIKVSTKAWQIKPTGIEGTVFHYSAFETAQNDVASSATRHTHTKKIKKPEPVIPYKPADLTDPNLAYIKPDVLIVSIINNYHIGLATL